MNIARETGALLDALAREGLPSMLVGAVALDALGVPRTTVDVDVQVATPRPLPRDASVLFGCIVEEWSRDPVFDQEVVIVHLPGSPIPFELFVTSHWATRQALERRHKAMSKLLGREVDIPTVEDFVLLKSAYMTASFRSRAKSAQDAVDIEGVSRLHALDRGYVEQNARRLGTWDRLHPLLP